MPRRASPLAALLFVAALLLGADPAEAGKACAGDGIGGTGMPLQRDSGIGGTGAPAAGDGTGGTGAIARDDGMGGTGIVGIVTGFGSICVNGIEVHYDNATPVDAGGQPAQAGALAIGQVVAVDAAGSGSDVKARRISIVWALSGPVTDVSRGPGRIAVMGQLVELAHGAALPMSGGPRKSGGALKPGDVVQVSGLRRIDGTVVATYIGADPRGGISVTGQLAARPGGGFSVHGLPVDLPAAAAPGTEVRLTGAWNGRTLAAREIVREPVQRLLDRAHRIEIQGYVDLHEPGAARVSGRQVQIPPGTRIAGVEGRGLASGDRVRISASVTGDRRLVAERITVEQTTRPRPDRLDGGRQPPRAAAAREMPASPAPERVESREAAERLERGDRVEKAEKAEKAEKPEKVEKAEKVEKPEKIEKAEKPEKPEKVEKPERRERH